MKKKCITVVVPTYNEETNIELMCKTIQQLFEMRLPDYQYDILIIDNKSKDNTRRIVESICEKNSQVRAIFNARNFGPINSPFYALCQTTSDAAILINADFQEPVQLIYDFVKRWEETGCQVVCAIRKSSKESRLLYSIRKLYYRWMESMSEFEQISNFNGFGLYDRSVIDLLKAQNDPVPFIRSMVAEFGFQREEIEYEQEKRKGGKSSFSFYRYYDFAMIGITEYTKVGMRLATFIGMICALLCFVIGLLYLIWKLVFWNSFTPGIAPIIVGVYFLGSLQLIFIGILGEYILTIKQRLMNRPLVIEQRRINF